MKKIKYLFIALSISLISCEDAYDIVQDGEFGEDVTFTAVSDMQDYLSGTYAQTSILPEIAITSLFTDELGLGNLNTGQNFDLYRFVLNRQDGYVNSMWLRHYTAINYANRLLRGAERITPSADVIPDPSYINNTVTPSRPYNEVELYNSIVGQAKALRAFSHLQLLSYFSEDLKNDASLGVIVMDRVPELNEDLPRNTTGEVYAFIEADLLAAEQAIIEPSRAVSSTFPNVRNPYNYVSKNLIYAMRARMYAYRGNYVLAEQNADWVIANSGLSLTAAGSLTGSTNGTLNTAFYATNSSSPYKRMFNDASQGEIIFSLARPINQEAIASLFFTNRTQVSGAVLHDMGRSLFNKLADRNNNGVVSNPLLRPADPEDQDVRAKAFIDLTSIINANPETVEQYRTADILAIDKYPGITGAVLNNDLKVFRLSEMYFIKAEARAAASDFATVATILKQIRDVRTYSYTLTGSSAVSQPAVPSPLPSYTSATEAWADILLERRKELCFEGHRYIDLKRLGTLANASIDRYFRDCEDASITICTFPTTDYRFVLPIPSGEKIGNPGIQQNPGY